jgi:hypothetical protein
MIVVVVAVVPVPIAVVTPAPVAYIFELAAFFTRPVAVAAETVGSAFVPRFGAGDTLAAVAPRLGLRRQAA